jgi:5-aminolevulinate synthase
MFSANIRKQSALIRVKSIRIRKLSFRARAAATAAIRHLKTSQWERKRHQDRAACTRAALTAAGLPVMASHSHIVPLFVGDPERCKSASDLLLTRHGVYIQPINYPTVPRGTERLRITPSPWHDDVLIERLVEALSDVWRRLVLPFADHSPPERDAKIDYMTDCVAA